MSIETGGTAWHQSNRGVSIFVAVYISLFLLVIVLSVRAEQQACVDVFGVKHRFLVWSDISSLFVLLFLALVEIPP